MPAGKDLRTSQPHEVRYVLYIVYEGQRSSPMAWSDHKVYIDTQEEYLRSQGHDTVVIDRDA